MKILALNWRDIRSPEAGGAEVYLHEVLRRLVKGGDEVTLLCSQFASGEGLSEETVDGVRVCRTGSWWNAHLTIPKAARRLMAAEAFDVVLDNVNKIPFCAPSWSRIPVVGLFYHLLGRTVYLETNPLAAIGIRLCEKRIGRVYKEIPVVAISRSTADELVSAGIAQDSITIAAPGLDHQSYGIEVQVKPERATFVVVSRLKAYKRVDVAIRALAVIRTYLPDAQLVVIGEGQERRRLERLARTLNQPVNFLGAASHADKFYWLNRAHLTLLPSMKEGWGLVAIESMACGTPVVASDVPGHRDSVAEGTGVLVPLGDPQAMAEEALRLLSDWGRYQTFRARGRAWANQFSWDATASALEKVLLSASGLPRSKARELEEALR